MSTPCMFCGRKQKLTREHVFPDWLAKEIHLPELVEMSTGSAEDATLRTWKTRPFAQTVREVCAECNNGWLSSLENKAKRSLLKLVQGQKVRLSTTTQHVLATWAAKTALVIDRTYGKTNIFPGESCRQLYTLKLPPPGTLVMLSAHSPYYEDSIRISITQSAQLASFVKDLDQQILSDVLPDARAGLMLFSVGNLVCTVFIHDVPEKMDISIGEPPGVRMEQYFQQIWPIVRHHYHWPNKSLTEMGGFEAAVKAWSTPRR